MGGERKKNFAKKKLRILTTEGAFKISPIFCKVPPYHSLEKTWVLGLERCSSLCVRTSSVEEADNKAVHCYTCTAGTRRAEYEEGRKKKGRRSPICYTKVAPLACTKKSFFAIGEFV